MNEFGKKTREVLGKVVSNKMDKTVLVEIARLVAHPRYGKVVRKFTKLKVHDEGNHCQVGDRVKMIQTRPLSKDKHWRVTAIVGPDGQPLR